MATHNFSLLTPARWLMDRLTYPRKFAVVSILFVLPLVAVLYFLLAEIHSRVEFAQQEIKGLKVLQEARYLQKEVGQALVFSADYDRGRVLRRPELIAQHGKIDVAMARLQAVDRELGVSLQTAAPMGVLQENQRFLRASLFGKSDDTATQLHHQLLDDIAQLARHVGDSSKLIIDPELDTYYLIDTVLLRLPVATDLLLDLRVLAQTVSARGLARPEELAELVRLEGLLQANGASVSSALSVVYANTQLQDLKPQLDPLANAYGQALKRVEGTVRMEFATASDFKAVGQRVETTIDEASKANSVLADAASLQLTKLLSARIDRATNQQLWTLLFSAVSLLLVAYLLSGFYASVMGIVQRLRKASERMNTGDFSDTVTLQTHDELGQVAMAFNTVALRLREEKHQADEESARARAAEAEVREHEAELVASREEALGAARAKAAFLATMSHEIRTPLNGVVGMSTLLGETRLDAEQRDYLQTIRLSSDQLLSVINDILDFSKIESGKLDLEREPLGLRSAVEEACDIAAPRAREKGLELIIDMPEPRPGGLPAAVLGDITRLRQVLINLINNAVKFTESGEVAVHVRLLQSDDGHGNPLIEFRVSDTGIGIPPERVGQLFQAFAQVDASTTRKYGGTGLGLAISKRIVELMGGEIGLQSVLGQGSTFWFTVAAPVAHIAASYGPAEVGALRDKRALIVDDNATNIRILLRQLQLWGMDVVSCESAEAALTALGNSTWVPDIVITDMHMPEMDGVTLAQRIKASSATQALPLVLLSSGFLPAGDESARLFAARLLKPARQNQLFDTLARCLSPTTHLNTAVDVPALELAKNVTVLVADDNAVNLKVASAILRKLGYGVITANDGQEAVEAVASAMQGHAPGAPLPFGAILMDLNMPDVDGLQATRQIQAAWGKLAPPIIAVTAAASEEDRNRCLNAGMDDYLTKPLQVAALSQMLEKWVAMPVAVTPAPTVPVPAAATEPPQAPQAATPDLDRVSVLDDSRLLEFIEFDDAERSMTKDVVRLFTDALPGLVTAIEQSAASGDALALSRAAHALKGSASNIGASALQALCSRIEIDASEGRLQAAQQLPAQLPSLQIQTLAALEKYQK